MKKALFLSLLAAAAIAGCGGGDDDHESPPPTVEVPGSASASIDGFVSYLSSLIASSNTDSLDPVDVSNVAPPTDDAAPPSSVD